MAPPSLPKPLGRLPADGTPHRTGSFGLLPVPASVGLARRNVRELLAAWGTDPETCDNAVLVTSELVTNALTHTASERIVCRLRTDGHRLRLEVEDENRGPAIPARRTAGPEDQGGRGLLLVGVLSSDWGVRDTARGSGRVVWAVLPTRPTAPSAALPARRATGAPAPGPAATRAPGPAPGLAVARAPGPASGPAGAPAPAFAAAPGPGGTGAPAAAAAGVPAPAAAASPPPRPVADLAPGAAPSPVPGAAAPPAPGAVRFPAPAAAAPPAPRPVGAPAVRPAGIPVPRPASWPSPSSEARERAATGLVVPAAHPTRPTPRSAEGSLPHGTAARP